MQKILEIPHWGQFIDVSDPIWQGRSCGIVSLAMILDYYNIPFDIKKLINKGLEIGGYLEGVGWKHQGIVDLAKLYGLQAERIENEKIKNMIKSIDKEEPVIISIHKHFDVKNEGHLAVLTGYFKEDDKIVTLFVNDPFGNPYKYKNHLVKYDKFIEGWKKRAIYLKKL